MDSESKLVPLWKQAMAVSEELARAVQTSKTESDWTLEAKLGSTALAMAALQGCSRTG